MISKKIKSKKNAIHWTDESLRSLADGILNGDRKALAKGITLVEGILPEQIAATNKLLMTLSQYQSASKCIAITGPPGAGKSTFIESVGKLILEEDNRLAVLSIDPSSELTGGSILGDKTRMPFLASHKNAFVRPSPSSGDLGGISRTSREVKILCEAAGYHVILVETVGVGQSESEVSHLVDMVVVLLQPGSGDELQSIKKGLNEMADFFVVNKADGDQMDLAREAKSAMLAAIKFGAKKPVVLHSFQDITMVRNCWQEMKNCFDVLIDEEVIESRRIAQSAYWFKKNSERAIIDFLNQEELFKSAMANYLDEIKTGKMNIYQAVQCILSDVQKRLIK